MSVESLDRPDLPLEPRSEIRETGMSYERVVRCHLGTVWLIVTVGVLACGPCYGHASGYVYPIWEVPTADLPDLTDGTMADWEEVVPGASLVSSDFVRLGESLDLTSLALRVFLAWHSQSQRIYVGVEVFDDRYVGWYEDSLVSEAWLQRWGGWVSNVLMFDSIAFIVDGDHSGGQYSGYDVEVLGWDAYANITNSQAQLYLAYADSPDGRRLAIGSAGNSWIPRPPYADIGTYQEGEFPSVTGYEFYVTPWDELHWAEPEAARASRLESGHIIGFNLLVRDYDEDAGPNAKSDFLYPYSPYAGAVCRSCTADAALDGELVPCHILDCGAAPAGSPTVSAVAGDSWARIKAAFTGDRRSSR